MQQDHRRHEEFGRTVVGCGMKIATIETSNTEGIIRRHVERRGHFVVCRFSRGVAKSGGMISVKSIPTGTQTELV
jgi:hypothetical protein